MATVQIPIENDLASLLASLNRPVEQAARELIVLELYRRGMVSSGKAAELLGMQRGDFIRHASGLGIPFFEMTEEEWDGRERRNSTGSRSWLRQET